MLFFPHSLGTVKLIVSRKSRKNKIKNSEKIVPLCVYVCSVLRVSVRGQNNNNNSQSVVSSSRSPPRKKGNASRTCPSNDEQSKARSNIPSVARLEPPPPHSDRAAGGPQIFVFATESVCESEHRTPLCAVSKSEGPSLPREPTSAK